MKRKHVEMNQDDVRYIGKEANDIEKSDIIGVFNGDVTEYLNQQKQIKDIIANLTEEKSRELGISRRSFFYIKQKIKIFPVLNINTNTMKKILDYTEVCLV